MYYRVTICIFLLIFCDLCLSQEFSYKEKKELAGYSSFTLEAEFSPFRNYFAMTIGNNSIDIFDRNWDKVFEFQGNPKSFGGNIAFSPDERYLAYSRYKSDNDIAIIRLEDMKVIQVLTGHAYGISDITYSNNGKYMASCSRDKTIKIWQWNNSGFDLLQTITDHTESVNTVSFSYDDRFLASAGNDKAVRIFRFERGEYNQFRVLDQFKGYVYSAIFHPQKDVLISGMHDNLQMWKLKNKEFVLSGEFREKVNVKNALAISPTGDYLVFGYYSTARIIGISDKGFEDTETIYRHSEHVFGGSFSRDGKFLSTFGGDNNAIIWEVEGVRPSDRSVIADYLGIKLTGAQKQVLTSEVCKGIISKLDKTLTQPRDEFENTVQYTKRREKLSDKVLYRLQQFIIKHYNLKEDKNTGQVLIPVEEIIGYNADKGIYKIRFLETEAGVEIPVEEARSFKKNWKKAHVSAERKTVKGNVSSGFDNYKLKHPVSGKTYNVTPVENPFHSGMSDYGGRKIKAPGSEGTSSMPGQKIQESAGTGTTRALLFATNVYDNFKDLINPVIDGKAIGEELKANYISETEVVINATLYEILTRLREYATFKYSPEDNLIIFFAGHGIYDVVFKEGYVISSDSEYNDLVRTTYLSHSNLRTIINNIPCQHILLIMDVCFGGTFDPGIASRSRAADMYADLSNEEFIKRKKKYKTRLYLTSGGKEYVPDGRPGHHSPFARRLLEALRNYGGQDRILTINEMLTYVQKINPQPCFGEFGDNEPGSDFIIIAK